MLCRYSSTRGHFWLLNLISASHPERPCSQLLAEHWLRTDLVKTIAPTKSFFVFFVFFNFQARGLNVLRDTLQFKQRDFKLCS